MIASGCQFTERILNLENNIFDVIISNFYKNARREASICHIWQLLTENLASAIIAKVAVTVHIRLCGQVTNTQNYVPIRPRENE